MYLGIDIGGTKTLLAVLNEHGVIMERLKFSTSHKYAEFITTLADNVEKLSTNKFLACGVAVPGRVDRTHGIGIAFGNLPWQNVPIKADVRRIVHCPVIIENDANLAGLSEAMLVKHKYRRILYVTISTGIGTGIIVDQAIEPAFADSEGGQILLEHSGKLEYWEDFASGRAIVERYGKQAHEITDERTWKHITHDIALGLLDLIAVVQPEVIIMGGSVPVYFDRFHTFLEDELHRYSVPLVPVPPIIPAGRPEDAVIYGCYDLAKATYEKAH